MALSNTDTVPNTPISMHPQMDSGVPGVKDIQGNPVRPSGAVPFPNSMQPKDLALANSMQGMIDDQRAVAQETKKVLEQLGGLATRLTQMMGNGQSGYNDIGSNVVRVPDPNGGILLSPTGSVLGIGPTPMAHPSHAHVVYAPIPGTSAAANPFTSSSNYQDQNRSNPLVTAAPQPSVNAQGVSTSGQSNWDAIPNQEAQTGSGGGGGGGGNVVQAPDPNQGGESTSEKIETPAIVAAGLLHRNFQKGQSMQSLASELKNKGTFRGVPGVGKFLYGTGTPAIAATAAGVAADGTITPAVEGAAAVAGTAGVLGGVAEGGGLLASAGGALMGSAAGPIGLGAGALYGAYKFGGDFFSHERAQGATFQSMEGGTNLQAQDERARQAEFGATQWGSLSGGQANKLFQGVTGLGWTGDKRQAGLNFATSNYRSMGMDPNESMTLLGSIAQNGAVNLNKLALALQDVTNTAASASLNTNLVRQSFTSTFTALQGAGVGTGAPGGGDAGALSAAVTNVITGMGPTVSKAGPKPDLTSTDVLTRQASALGMDPGTYLSKTMQKGGGALTAKAQDAMLAQVLPSIQGTSKNWKQLQSDLAKNPTKLGQDPSKTLQEEVAMDTPGGVQSMSGFLKAAGAIGSDIDPNKNAPGVLAAYTEMIQGNLSGSGANSLPKAVTKSEADAAAKEAARLKAQKDYQKEPWYDKVFSKLDENHVRNDLKSWGANLVSGVAGIPSAAGRILTGEEVGISQGDQAGATEPNARSAGAPPGYRQGSDGKWYPPGQGSLTPGWNALSSLVTPPSTPSTPPKPTPPTPPPKVDVVLSWKDPSWGAKINAAINQIPTNATQIPPNPFSATS